MNAVLCALKHNPKATHARPIRLNEMSEEIRRTISLGRENWSLRVGNHEELWVVCAWRIEDGKLRFHLLNSSGLLQDDMAKALKALGQAFSGGTLWLQRPRMGVGESVWESVWIFLELQCRLAENGEDFFGTISLHVLRQDV